MTEQAAAEQLTLCTVCGLRPGTEKWVGHGGVLGLVHGQYSMRCQVCVLEEQLSYARERAAAIPQLEADLAAARDDIAPAARSGPPYLPETSHPHGDPA